MADEPRLPESFARAICAKAMLSGRCSELLGVLMENGSVTLDQRTNELVFYTAEQLGQVMADSFEGCETGLSPVRVVCDCVPEQEPYVSGLGEEPVLADEVELFARRKVESGAG